MPRVLVALAGRIGQRDAEKGACIVFDALNRVSGRGGRTVLGARLQFGNALVSVTFPLPPTDTNTNELLSARLSAFLVTSTHENESRKAKFPNSAYRAL